MIAKADFDRPYRQIMSVTCRDFEARTSELKSHTFKSVNIAIITCTLISFMFLHQREKLLCGPSLRLKVIIIGS